MTYHRIQLSTGSIGKLLVTGAALIKQDNHIGIFPMMQVSVLEVASSNNSSREELESRSPSRFWRTSACARKFSWSDVASRLSKWHDASAQFWSFFEPTYAHKIMLALFWFLTRHCIAQSDHVQYVLYDGEFNPCPNESLVYYFSPTGCSLSSTAPPWCNTYVHGSLTI